MRLPESSPSIGLLAGYANVEQLQLTLVQGSAGTSTPFAPSTPDKLAITGCDGVRFSLQFRHIDNNPSDDRSHRA
jgi:hypothetical protein